MAQECITREWEHLPFGCEFAAHSWFGNCFWMKRSLRSTCEFHQGICLSLLIRQFLISRFHWIWSLSMIYFKLCILGNTTFISGVCLHCGYTNISQLAINFFTFTRRRSDEKKMCMQDLLLRFFKNTLPRFGIALG